MPSKVEGIVIVGGLHLKAAGTIQPDGIDVVCLYLERDLFPTFRTNDADCFFYTLPSVPASPLLRPYDKAINADLVFHLVQPETANGLLIQHPKIEALPWPL